MGNKENALLESPTGTGKTLALLAASLSFQDAEYRKAVQKYTEESIEFLKKTGVMPNGTLGHEKSSIPRPAIGQPEPKYPERQRIFFCSRTHSQLKQVVDELRDVHPKLLEDLQMCILGSRNQMCINEDVRERATEGSGTLDELCRDLSKTRVSGCSFNNSSNNASKGLAKATGKHAVWDIEDAVVLGRKHKGCPYYHSRQVAPGADITFMPYNYILEPSIRASLQLELQDAIIIFDEAHNLEDFCRSAGSLSIGTELLRNTQFQVSILILPPCALRPTAWDTPAPTHINPGLSLHFLFFSTLLYSALLCSSSSAATSQRIGPTRLQQVQPAGDRHTPVDRPEHTVSRRGGFS
jgi:Rad3-related DNA helicase